MVDLERWLGQQLDVDAAEIANPYAEKAWHARDCESVSAVLYPDRETGACDCGVPARVLREITARRRTLNQHKAAVERMDQAMRDNDPAAYQRAMTMEVAFRAVLRNDAAVYSDRLGYRDEWRP